MVRFGHGSGGGRDLFEEGIARDPNGTPVCDTYDLVPRVTAWLTENTPDAEHNIWRGDFGDGPPTASILFREVAPLSVEQLEAEFRLPPLELVEAYANLSDDPATGTD